MDEQSQVCNAFSVRLLDICKSICIRVVNGRLCDDCNKGDFTFISHNGSSVIDYLLTKECNFSNISQFKILENNVFSDHSPVVFIVTWSCIAKARNSRGGQSEMG